MKWFRIPKEKSLKPSKGSHYSDWKEDLAIEGEEQCVYCTININSFGGIRNFHVEHYKPKAKDKFPELENDFNNLFFACSICNCFKSDDWPNEPSEKFDNHSFPDPSKVDYSTFLISDNDFKIKSKFVTGEYIIQKLFLNRPQLLLERKSYYLHEVLKRESQDLKNILLKIKSMDSNTPIVDGYIQAMEVIVLLIDEKYINPYEQKQTRR